MSKRALAGFPVLMCMAAGICLSQHATSLSILRFSPTSGPEGTRIVITGDHLQEVTAALLGSAPAEFRIVSPQKLFLIVPHKSATSVLSLVSPSGRVSSPFAFEVANDPRIPAEVSYKAGYINSIPRPEGFTSARLWGIAIADVRAARFESAQVEVAWTQLSCLLNGQEIVLNDDANQLAGGLYLREPWFGGHDYHEVMPVKFDPQNRAVILRVGERADRVWHFWSPSPRAGIPHGALTGCTARARVKISPGALLQMGFDYWRSRLVPYGAGGNNHEAGASDWYFPSNLWQEAVFSDLGGPQF
jgi:hypothetical protein